MILYHATSASSMEKIIKEGQIRPGSYWASDEAVHRYYLDTIEDEGEIPVSIMLDLGSVEESALQPDIEGIEEPLSFTLKKSDEVIMNEWLSSEKNWQASLAIIGSLKVSSSIEVALLQMDQANENSEPSL